MVLVDCRIILVGGLPQGVEWLYIGSNFLCIWQSLRNVAEHSRDYYSPI